MERMNNIDLLTETLEICEQGSYTVNGKQVTLKLSPEEMRQVQVFLPEEIERLEPASDLSVSEVDACCRYRCEKKDSFSAAREWSQNPEYQTVCKHQKEGRNEILVLNFANPVNPGGGVRLGARAQEEDLCRKSSLLLSLETSQASRYYNYNRGLSARFMGSNAVMITPKVEIIRDENGDLLDETIMVSVMTCAAPYLRYGLDGLTQQQYEDLFYRRIVSMLRCASHMGYQNLVLGAFGCGAFGNDAKVVSDLFSKAFRQPVFENGRKGYHLFREVDFAVLSRDPKEYNYKEFYRNFGNGNFYREEDKARLERDKAKVLERIREREKNLDKIRGSLVGGAVGDALGYPVEFWTAERIIREYGESGITEYELDQTTGKALISDDTQMTLFTADGILVADTKGKLSGVTNMYGQIERSYQCWLLTQKMNYASMQKEQQCKEINLYSWLLDIPELYSRRAPGNTCLMVLEQIRQGKLFSEECIKNPRNDSKGCGGIMRIAPLGMYYDVRSRYEKGSVRALARLDRDGAMMAAITHGHPLGYLPAAVLTHILNRIVYPENPQMTLKEIIFEARDTVHELFGDSPDMELLCRLIDRAVTLSENRNSDLENIRQLGEGWVAEETLAIALYCSLRYEHDFSGGVIAAVNHDGDSDSTGAVTGNILGAINGYEAIEEKWKKNLELSDVILEMADDLCHGCVMEEYGRIYDCKWMKKYFYGRW